MPIILPPKRILFGESHSRVYSRSRQYQDGPQRTTVDFMKIGKLETTYPEATFIVGKHYRSSTNTLTVVLVLVNHCTTATQLFEMPTRPSPAFPSANLITTPFSFSFPIGRNSYRKYPC
jgi:hypothetical protein